MLSSLIFQSLFPQAKNVYFEFPVSVTDIILPKFSLAVLLFYPLQLLGHQCLWSLSVKFLCFFIADICTHALVYVVTTVRSVTTLTFLFPVLSSNLSPFNSSSRCSKNYVPEISLFAVSFLFKSFVSSIEVVIYCSIGYRHIWFIHIFIAIWPLLHCYFYSLSSVLLNSYIYYNK